MTRAKYEPRPELRRLEYSYDAGDERRGISTTTPDIAAEILRFGEPERDGDWVKCSDGTWFRTADLVETGKVTPKPIRAEGEDGDPR